MLFVLQVRSTLDPALHHSGNRYGIASEKVDLKSAV